MYKKLQYEKKWRYSSKLVIFLIFDIMVSITLYYAIEQSTNHITLKFIMNSFLIIFAIFFSMIYTLKIEREISSVDPLTGAYNRRRLYFDLNKLIKSNNNFELIFIDLNNFKEINDSYGHEAGDEILGKFGEKAVNLGNNISCYRTGGDEFIILANNTICSIEKLAEFDFSYGISKFPEDTAGIENTNDIIDELLSVADKKMYKRKREMKRV